MNYWLIILLILGWNHLFCQKQEYSDKWPNGKKRSEGSYVSGFEEGLWKYYDEDGNLSEESHYRKGKLHGKVLQYFPNGSIMAEGYFFKGKPDSVYIEYSPGGNKLVIGNYNSGIKTGEWIAFHDNNDTLSKEIFVDSLRKLWYYSPAKDTITLRNGMGFAEEFYPNG